MLLCDHDADQLTYLSQPWTPSLITCQPFCGKEGCHNGGQCVAPEQCQCVPGFSGDQCQHRECDPPCQNGGTCIENGHCDCPTGYWGPLCQLRRCTLPRQGLSHSSLGGTLSR
ncbi:hypothetical protein OTU49_015313, partial [Cherax quadricarinatus]